MTRLQLDNTLWEQVSKAIEGIFQQWEIKNNNGTIKFLKFDAEKAYPRHHHPDRTEWLYVISGEMIAEIDDRTHNLSEGEFALFPLNSEHSLKAGRDGAVVLVVAIYEDSPHIQ
jgi:quercetin dioxygenase-like cupin family protein